ncbi:MAG: hypothetical protein ACI8W8_000741 [Rhodothermales bacterium]|jgi:hypothetical protein
MNTRLTLPLLFASFLLAASPTVLHSTGVLSSSSPGQRIDIDIQGIDNLWLMAEGIPSHLHGHAIWGEAVLIDSDGVATRVCDLKPVTAVVGRGKYTVNRNPTGKRLRIGSRTLAHGLFAHADSALHFVLNKRFVRFRALVGIESLAPGDGNVCFTVATNEVRIAKTDQ